VSRNGFKEVLVVSSILVWAAGPAFALRATGVEESKSLSEVQAGLEENSELVHIGDLTIKLNLNTFELKESKSPALRLDRIEKDGGRILWREYLLGTVGTGDRLYVFAPQVHRKPGTAIPAPPGGGSSGGGAGTAFFFLAPVYGNALVSLQPGVKESAPAQILQLNVPKGETAVIPIFPGAPSPRIVPPATEPLVLVGRYIGREPSGSGSSAADASRVRVAGESASAINPNTLTPASVPPAVVNPGSISTPPGSANPPGQTGQIIQPVPLRPSPEILSLIAAGPILSPAQRARLEVFLGTLPASNSQGIIERLFVPVTTVVSIQAALERIQAIQARTSSGEGQVVFSLSTGQNRTLALPASGSAFPQAQILAGLEEVAAVRPGSPGVVRLEQMTSVAPGRVVFQVSPARPILLPPGPVSVEKAARLILEITRNGQPVFLQSPGNGGPEQIAAQGRNTNEEEQLFQIQGRLGGLIKGAQPGIVQFTKIGEQLRVAAVPLSLPINPIAISKAVQVILSLIPQKEGAAATVGALKLSGVGGEQLLTLSAGEGEIRAALGKVAAVPSGPRVGFVRLQRVEGAAEGLEIRVAAVPAAPAVSEGLPSLPSGPVSMEPAVEILTAWSGTGPGQVQQVEFLRPGEEPQLLNLISLPKEQIPQRVRAGLLGPGASSASAEASSLSVRLEQAEREVAGGIERQIVATVIPTALNPNSIKPILVEQIIPVRQASAAILELGRGQVEMVRLSVPGVDQKVILRNPNVRELESALRSFEPPSPEKGSTETYVRITQAGQGTPIQVTPISPSELPAPKPTVGEVSGQGVPEAIWRQGVPQKLPKLIFRPGDAILAVFVPAGMEENVKILYQKAEDRSYILSQRPQLAQAAFILVDKLEQVDFMVQSLRNQEGWEEATDVRVILPSDPGLLRQKIETWLGGFGWEMPDLFWAKVLQIALEYQV